ncbi:TorF family putative porin [Kordiimonas marina]|uniref:TorF family putative porin n=1 Tax=Kordiimonas marina TaxID=2872312 RepID=UPI001FF5F611|nr:TorF family putative porin [Kordiimonas marina]MCJ9427817.1 TorF family putative porin [Kordiimonas marina]
MKTLLLATTALAALSFPAMADDGGFSIDGYVGGVSDYRDRGIALSEKDPAVVASIGAYHENGLYFGVTGASINDQVGGDVRAKFFGGYRIDKGDYVYDLSVELDSFHGGGDRYYPDIRATVSRDFGIAFIRGGLNYAPDGRWSLPDNNSLYAFTNLEVPIPNVPELTFVSRAGYDMRGGGRSNLWDWGVGLSAFISDLELSVMYEDSSLDGRLGKGAVTFGAKYYF